jgi:hypothetical protein
LDFSAENVSSSHQSSEESVRCQKESEGILGPHPPYILEIGKIKGRICDASLMENHKDDKVNNDNVKYAIPMKRYTEPFKEKLSSESFHLAPMQDHQFFFKEDYPKWPKVRNKDSHENCYPQYLGITRRSCLEAHRSYTWSTESRIDLSMVLEGPSFFFFFARLVLLAETASITIGLDLHQKRLLLHEVIGPRYHGMCHV